MRFQRRVRRDDRRVGPEGEFVLHTRRGTLPTDRGRGDGRQEQDEKKAAGLQAAEAVRRAADGQRPRHHSRRAGAARRVRVAGQVLRAQRRAVRRAQGVAPEHRARGAAQDARGHRAEVRERHAPGDPNVSGQLRRVPGAQEQTPASERWRRRRRDRTRPVGRGGGGDGRNRFRRHASVRRRRRPVPLRHDVPRGRRVGIRRVAAAPRENRG